MLLLMAFAGGAAVGMTLTRGPLRLLFLLVIPVIAYVALRLARHRWWLEGSVLFKQRAFRAKRIDLSHAQVETGYIAGGSRLTTIKVFDPIHRTRMTIPLLTASGRTLPPEEIKSLHDAIMAGQRWRQKKAADRAATVSSYLQSLA